MLPAELVSVLRMAGCMARVAARIQHATRTGAEEAPKGRERQAPSPVEYRRMQRRRGAEARGDSGPGTRGQILKCHISSGHVGPHPAMAHLRLSCVPSVVI